MDYLIELIAGAIAVIFIFTPHEFAHAFIAYKNGDTTAKMYGRLTLNPVKHIDPTGFVLCALAGFGWAKPVPIDPANFRSYKKGLFTTAIAGVIANYIVAFIVYPLYLLFLNKVYVANYEFLADKPAFDFIVSVVYMSFFLIYAYSLNVFVFNLLPFPPLDGFRVVQSLTREINPVHRFLKNYGSYILIGLVVESFLCNILSRYGGGISDIIKYFNILNYLQSFAVKILGFPISAFWDWIIQPDSIIRIITVF